MKKIIKGKMYNTDTAEMLAEYDNGYSCTDFNWYEESLYLKRTGEYFVYGVGGPLSKYSKPCGHGCTGGDGFRPLTEVEARAWVEYHCDGEEYENIFGPVEE